MSIGKISQIIGPVVDVVFEDRHSLPKLYYALTVGGQNVTLEVAQHIGNESVRCISMNPTDGLMRGMSVTNTGAPISVPVGDQDIFYVKFKSFYCYSW